MREAQVLEAERNDFDEQILLLMEKGGLCGQSVLWLLRLLERVHGRQILWLGYLSHY